MKTHDVVWKMPPLNDVLRGLFVVLLLAALPACSDPVSIDDDATAAALETTLDRTEGSDKTTDTTDPNSDGGDQDDPNAPPVGGDEDDDHEGPPNGDYADINRPGQIIICHVPAGDAAPASLSLLPDAVAEHIAHPDDYDGPCAEEDKEGGSSNGDQGSNDQDDPNAPPVGGDDEENDDGTNTSNLNNGRGSAGM